MSLLTWAVSASLRLCPVVFTRSFFKHGHYSTTKFVLFNVWLHRIFLIFTIAICMVSCKRQKKFRWSDISGPGVAQVIRSTRFLPVSSGPVYQILVWVEWSNLPDSGVGQVVRSTRFWCGASGPIYQILVGQMVQSTDTCVFCRCHLWSHSLITCVEAFSQFGLVLSSLVIYMDCDLFWF